ncbi:MAG: SEC-C domain-containing protein, partial [Actinomycetota bacterium]|nr:SEC-C domain-containing protein [Actinomycetota bacterium]
ASLEEALSAGHSAAALIDAASFAADRGDARGALAHLRTGGIPADDPDAVLLARYTATGPEMVGRNDDCWCGSGKKHKKCCLALNGWPLHARAAWLHAKAIAFLQRPPQRTELLRVATAHAGVASSEEAPARVIAAACDTTVTELCLAEGGVFARFLEVRGQLLPADERELAASWVGARHGLWRLGDDGQLTPAGDGDARALDPESAAKVPAGAVVLAAVHDGPLAIPGPALPVQNGALDVLTEALATGDAVAIGAVVGREFGWTAAPDLGSDADRAPDALSTSP